MKIDELRNIVRELIKKELEEASTLGTGAAFNPGSSEAYSTPFAFRKNRIIMTIGIMLGGFYKFYGFS